MCMACDEQAMFYRAWLQDTVALGIIPDGVTAEDFAAYGLLVPEQLRKPAPEPADAFACDSPE